MISWSRLSDEDDDFDDDEDDELDEDDDELDEDDDELDEDDELVSSSQSKSPPQGFLLQSIPRILLSAIIQGYRTVQLK